MHWFLIMASTKNRTFSGLGNTNLLSYSSVGQKSDMGLVVSLLKSKCLHGFIPFWRLQRRICFLAFSSFYRLPAFLGSWALSSIFQASNGVLSLSCAASLPPPLLPPSSTIKDPCGYSGPTGILFLS